MNSDAVGTSPFHARLEGTRARIGARVSALSRRSVLGCLVLAISAGLAACVPPPWPTFHQNYQRTGASRVDTSADNGTLKWKLEFPNNEFFFGASPAIGYDGTIYVGGTSGNLYAVNSDGTLKWQFPTGGNVATTPSIFVTPPSLPALRNKGNGTIYIDSDDRNLYALNPDGTLKWKFTTGGLVEISPALGGNGTIYFGSDFYFYALFSDGTLQWKFATRARLNVSPPSIGSDGTIYFGNSVPDSSAGSLYALNSDGTLKWKFGIGQSLSTPALGADGTIYVGSDSRQNLYAVNPDGTLKWTFATAGAVGSSAALGADGTIYVGSYDDNLYAINPEGALKWKFTTDGPVRSSPAVGADGTLYLNSSSHGNGYLYAIH